MLTENKLCFLATLWLLGTILLVNGSIAESNISLVLAVLCFLFVIFEAAHHRDWNRYCIEKLLSDEGDCYRCVGIGGELCPQCLTEMEDAFGDMVAEEEANEHYESVCYVCSNGSNPHIVCDDCYQECKGDLRMRPRCDQSQGYSYMCSIRGVWHGPFDAMGPCVTYYKREGGGKK